MKAAETDPVAAIRELGGADVAMVPAATPVVLEQAHPSPRRGGRLVLASQPNDNIMRLAVEDALAGRVTARVVPRP